MFKQLIALFSTLLVLASLLGVGGWFVWKLAHRAKSIHTSAPEFAPDKEQFVAGHAGMALSLLVRVGAEPARDRDATVDFGADCELGPAVFLDGLVYSDFPDMEVDGKPVPADHVRPLAQLPGLKAVWWMSVEPEGRRYTNSDDTPGWWDDIRYRESVFEARANATLIPGDVRPLVQRPLEWEGLSVGTLRYKVALEFQDFFLSSPGSEAVEKAGFVPGVRRLSRKGGTGVDCVDYGFALGNLPYIWGSGSRKGSAHPEWHQAEHYIGADCADLLMAGWRLAGLTGEEYSGVVKLVDDYSRSPRLHLLGGYEDGIFQDEDGHPLDFGPQGTIRPGAGILWVYNRGRNGHAGILALDSGPDGEPNGLLDRDDLVLHTYNNTPLLEPLRGIMPLTAPRAVLNPPGQ